MESSASNSVSTILSCAALVAGTTIGAGVLAIPSVTLPVGFWPSTVLMLGAWLYMVASGLLIAEANLHASAQVPKEAPKESPELSRPDELGLLATVDRSLGRWSAIAVGVVYVFIHYALLIAYVARGGDILAGAIAQVGHWLNVLDTATSTVPLWWGHVVFALLFSNVLFWGGYQQITRLNSVLVAAVIVAFWGLFGLAMGESDVARLQVQHWTRVNEIVPVMFVAFVYQNVVPVIVKRLDGDGQKVRWSIWLGSLVPLVMFALWNGVILAAIPLGDQALDGIDPLEWLRMSAADSTLGLAVAVFSELAIATSFIGFVFGLLDVFEDVFSENVLKPDVLKQYRKPFFYLLTFVPPLLLSLINPNIFYDAIDFAGAFGISILFGIIPVLMVWKLRQESVSATPLLGGGRPLLLCMGALALGVILQNAVIKFGAFALNH